jgi:bifunctional oligoribonuclease and PAP phosphatase NrnA
MPPSWKGFTMNNLGDPLYAQKLETIAARLKNHNGTIVIAAHVDPDGDAIGSVLGAARALHTLGKNVQPVGIAPRYLEWMPQHNELTPKLEVLPTDCLLLVLDSAEVSRVDGVPMNQEGIPIINIDHHGSNPRFGEIALVSPDKSACALMVKDLVSVLGVELTAHIAEPILTGILTDTGFFRNSNTDSGVMRAAADLLESGVQLTKINEALAAQPRSFYGLQSEVYATIEYPLGGKMIMATVNNAMLEKLGANWEDVESLVGYIRNAEGTVLACLFKDYGDTVKVSLRSKSGVSAQNIAIACGGGGHVPAAGATLAMPFAQAKEKLLFEAQRELERAGLA